MHAYIQGQMNLHNIATYNHNNTTIEFVNMEKKLINIANNSHLAALQQKLSKTFASQIKTKD